MDRQLMYVLLTAVDEKRKMIPADFGMKRGPFDAAMKELQDQGYIAGAIFQCGGQRHTHPYPLFALYDGVYPTQQGIQFIDDHKKSGVDLTVSNDLIS